MKEIEFIESLKVLEIKENDIVVVKVDYKIGDVFSEKLSKMVDDNLPNSIKGKIKILVLDRGIDIGIIRYENNGII